MKVELTEEGYTLDKKWKLVPVDADDQMTDAGWEIEVECHNHGKQPDIIYLGDASAKECWKSMLENSPKPDLSGLQSVKGIHVGGELLPEFNSDNGIHY